MTLTSMYSIIRNKKRDCRTGQSTIQISFYQLPAAKQLLQSFIHDNRMFAERAFYYS